MAETSIVYVTQSTTTEVRYDTVTTQTSPTGRIVEGIHFYGADGRGVVQAVDGVIEEDWGTVADGNGTKALASGIAVGTIGQSGSVTFEEPYADAPHVVLLHGGLTVQEGAVWGTRTQALQNTGTNAAPTAYYASPQFEVTPDGFTSSFVLIEEVSTLTRETASFGAPLTLTSQGVTGIAVPDIATNPAIDDTFEVPYSGTITANRKGRARIVVTMEARANGSNWFEIASAPHVTRFGEGGGTYNFDATLVGTKFSMGVGGADGIRIRLKRISLPSDSSTVSVTIDGTVSWRSGSPDYANMLPEDGDKVTFMVFSGGTASSFPQLIW